MRLIQWVNSGFNSVNSRLIRMFFRILYLMLWKLESIFELYEDAPRTNIRIKFYPGKPGYVKTGVIQSLAKILILWIKKVVFSLNSNDFIKINVPARFSALDGEFRVVE